MIFRFSENCKVEEFSCKSGECIPSEELCNGQKTCMDGSDETKEACYGRPCPA